MAFWLCFLHLMGGKVEPAAGSDEFGTGLCAGHGSNGGELPANDGACAFIGCGHPAWTLLAGRPICVKDAIDGRLGDDMDEHSLFVDLYEELRLRGHPDAY